MRKILDQKIWSQGTPSGYLGAHLAPYSGSRKFLFGDFDHPWDGQHYHASHCSGEFHDSQRCFGSYVHAYCRAGQLKSILIMHHFLVSYGH